MLVLVVALGGCPHSKYTAAKLLTVRAIALLPAHRGVELGDQMDILVFVLDSFISFLFFPAIIEIEKEKVIKLSCTCRMRVCSSNCRAT